MTVNEFTGSSTAPVYLAEYTRTGAFVQQFSGLPIGTERKARDVVVGGDGATYVYSGTFTPTLNRRDPVTGAWTGQTFNGWSTVNNSTYGGLAADRRYIYATDMNTGGGALQGVVRFDTQGGPTTRFATGVEPIDLTVGLDGFLYTFEGGSSVSTVRKFDRDTLAQVGPSVALPFQNNGFRAIAVDADGSIVAGQFDNIVQRFSPDGTLLNSLTVPGIYGFSDIDINPLTGEIALGSGFSSLVAIVDSMLTSSVTVQVSASGQGDVFVAWVVAPVPEPASVGVVALAAAAIAGIARQRKFIISRPTL